MKGGWQTQGLFSGKEQTLTFLPVDQTHLQTDARHTLPRAREGMDVHVLPVWSRPSEALFAFVAVTSWPFKQNCWGASIADLPGFCFWTTRTKVSVQNSDVSLTFSVFMCSDLLSLCSASSIELMYLHPWCMCPLLFLLYLTSQRQDVFLILSKINGVFSAVNYNMGGLEP